MKAWLRRRKPLLLVFGALALCVGGLTAGRHLGGAHHERLGHLRESPGLPAAEAATLDGAQESVVLAQRKRVMGRLRSLEMVRRTATQIRPILDRALEQRDLQADLAAPARAAGMSVPQYKEYFKGKEEADLLLESGGDPNARSSANAIGVAQFMVGTGQKCGLRVNLAASNQLSRRLDQIENSIAFLEAQPPDWSQPVPAPLRGVQPKVKTPPARMQLFAPPAPRPQAPPAGSWTRDQWLAFRRSQWDDLVAKRRAVDQRFDPAKAIPCQARYLVRLARRYGTIDWALQAYHGGEAGVSKTMALFAGSGASRSQLASRGSGSRFVTYSELYRRISPRGTPAAFSYLYGRADDHRYYWWKVLMAERALNGYRKDEKSFEREWQSLKPGQSADAAWYPDPTPLQFADPSALREAYRSKALVFLPKAAVKLGVHTENVASLEPESSGLHKGLRPEAMGALLKVAQIYRSQGGAGPVVAVALAQSNEYRQKWNARYPPKPLPPNVPRDPEFHSTGLTFDLKKPQREWDRKVLEYALGRLYDTLQASWRAENNAGTKRYHVVVNPQFKTELADYYHKLAK